MYLDMGTVFAIMIALASSTVLLVLTTLANAKLQERNRYLRNFIKELPREI